MITDAQQTRFISNLGWVDHGSLWVFDSSTDQVASIRLSGAGYLTLLAGDGDYFAAVHGYQGETCEITVHGMESPGDVVARLRVDGWTGRFDGDAGAWRRLPRAYVAYLNEKTMGVWGYYLIRVGDEEPPGVSVERLDWFSADAYDIGYQSVMKAVEIPGEPRLIMTIQRDSQPVIYDPNRREIVGRLTLADGFGNPTLRFRKHAPELWADDYDTLLRLDVRDWKVLDKILLQGADQGTRQFIGGWGFTPDESLCAVARPFSGDVIALGCDRFAVTHRAETGGQPIDVGILADGRVIARDWKTGDLLRGTLRGGRRLRGRR